LSSKTWSHVFGTQCRLHSAIKYAKLDRVLSLFDVRRHYYPAIGCFVSTAPCEIHMLTSRQIWILVTNYHSTGILF